MSGAAHKDNTVVFRALDISEQAKSITAQINNLRNQILVHVQTAEDPMKAAEKCVRQIERLLGRINAIRETAAQ